MNSYRDCYYEAWKDGGYIVDLGGDEVHCETIEEVKQLIDEYLDAE